MMEAVFHIFLFYIHALFSIAFAAPSTSISRKVCLAIPLDTTFHRSLSNSKSLLMNEYLGIGGSIHKIYHLSHQLLQQAAIPSAIQPAVIVNDQRIQTMLHMHYKINSALVLMNSAPNYALCNEMRVIIFGYGFVETSLIFQAIHDALQMAHAMLDDLKDGKVPSTAYYTYFNDNDTKHAINILQKIVRRRDLLVLHVPTQGSSFGLIAMNHFRLFLSFTDIFFKSSSTRRSAIVLHEMTHFYGVQDVTLAVTGACYGSRNCKLLKLVAKYKLSLWGQWPAMVRKDTSIIHFIHTCSRMLILMVIMVWLY
jgi:hypothetical protein